MPDTTDKENRVELSLANAAAELNEARVAAAANNDLFSAIGRALQSVRRIQAKVAKQQERSAKLSR